MAKKKPESDALLELPVSFGNLNVGDETARLGVSVSRGALTVSQADKHLCGKRLTGEILARTNGAQADQGALPGLVDDITVEGVFDVGGFTASPKKIGFGLTFLLSASDVTQLARFARREGRVTITGIENIPDDEADDGE